MKKTLIGRYLAVIAVLVMGYTGTSYAAGYGGPTILLCAVDVLGVNQYLTNTYKMAPLPDRLITFGGTGEVWQSEHFTVGVQAGSGELEAYSNNKRAEMRALYFMIKLRSLLGSPLSHISVVYGPTYAVYDLDITGDPGIGSLVFNTYTFGFFGGVSVRFQISGGVSIDANLGINLSQPNRQWPQSSGVTSSIDSFQGMGITAGISAMFGGE